MLPRNLATCLALTGTILVARASADLTDPIPGEIAKGSIAIGLKTIATGLVSPDNLIPAPDGSNEQFVVEQTGQVRVIQNGQRSDRGARMDG
jgi:hypothetical protein